jgi:hypothetical protein
MGIDGELGCVGAIVVDERGKIVTQPVLSVVIVICPFRHSVHDAVGRNPGRAGLLGHGQCDALVENADGKCALAGARAARDPEPLVVDDIAP